MTGILDNVVSKWSWSVNDVIVLSTVVTFVFVVIACSIMWTSRPPPKKVADDVDRIRYNWQNTSLENAGGGGTANTSGKSKGSSSNKKRSSRSRRSSKSNRDLEAGVGGSHESPSLEVDSLLGGHMPDMGDGSSSLPPSQGDSVLAQTLLSVLSQGMMLMIYNERGAKQANVTLVGGSELHWRTVKMFAKKGKQMNLREVLFVNWGKQTNKFHLPGSKTAIDECCFSLVTAKDTIDFEASSKVERDALAQGFTILLTRFKEKRPVEELSWGKI